MYQYDYDDIAKRYIDTVYRLALSHTKAREHAEDVTQEVFLRLLEKNPVFDTEEHLKAWLLRVCINCTKDLFKSAWFSRTDELKADVPIESGQSDLYYAMLQLPKKYRTVLHLHYYEGYNVEETARIIGAAKGTVKSQLHRGREILKNLLDDTDVKEVNRLGKRDAG